MGVFGRAVTATGQREGGVGDVLAGGTAEGYLAGVVADDDVAQFVVVGFEVEDAGVGPAEVFGFDQHFFQEPVKVFFGR